MKKSKITFGLLTGLLSVTALVSCDPHPTYSPEGYILTYKDPVSNTVQHYTANDLFNSYAKDSSSISVMFDKIYKLIVRNYFEQAGHEDDIADLDRNAKNDVDAQKTKANNAAETNNTNYDDEFDAILKSYSCDDEEDLYEHFYYDRALTKFEDQFYNGWTKKSGEEVKGHYEVLRDGETGYEGYLEKKVPYHVSHILVKTGGASSTAYYNDTITKDATIKLYNVVSALVNGTESFGSIAARLSEDTGSAAKFGDLGIMDKDTSFINEFKLGVYAYENLYAKEAIQDAAEGSAIEIPNIEVSDNVTIKRALGDSVGYIPLAVFEKMYEVADVTTGYNNAEVNSGSSLYFPRNIYFNKYLNKHRVSFITPYDTELPTNLSDQKYDEVDTENGSFTVNSFGGISLLGDTTWKANWRKVGDSDRVVLCTKAGDPILVVRGGSGEGDSGYQGIHFIVINKSGLESKETLSKYYTTKYQGFEEGELNYVNFLDQDVINYKTRADEVQSKLKSFDTHINAYVFKKAIAPDTDPNKDHSYGTIELKDEALKVALNSWIELREEKEAFDANIEWERTWKTYGEALLAQDLERQKLLSEVAAITYNTQGHALPEGVTVEGYNAEDFWGNGGLFGENK